MIYVVAFMRFSIGALHAYVVMLAMSGGIGISNYKFLFIFVKMMRMIMIVARKIHRLNNAMQKCAYYPFIIT